MPYPFIPFFPYPLHDPADLPLGQRDKAGCIRLGECSFDHLADHMEPLQLPLPQHDNVPSRHVCLLGERSSVALSRNRTFLFCTNRTLSFCGDRKIFAAWEIFAALFQEGSEERYLPMWAVLPIR